MSNNITFPLPGEKYKHYKGGTYEIISMATHSETNEQMVVYKSLNFGGTYTRPYSMWDDPIDKVGYATTLRFTKIN